MSSSSSPEYLAIGHLSVDRTPEGPMLGGTVMYGALTAARFGARAAVLTRGNLQKLDPEVPAGAFRSSTPGPARST